MDDFDWFDPLRTSLITYITSQAVPKKSTSNIDPVFFSEFDNLSDIVFRDQSGDWTSTTAGSTLITEIEIIYIVFLISFIGRTFAHCGSRI